MGRERGRKQALRGGYPRGLTGAGWSPTHATPPPTPSPSFFSPARPLSSWRRPPPPPPTPQGVLRRGLIETAGLSDRTHGVCTLAGDCGPLPWLPGNACRGFKVDGVGAAAESAHCSSSATPSPSSSLVRELTRARRWRIGSSGGSLSAQRSQGARGRPIRVSPFRNQTLQVMSAFF